MDDEDFKSYLRVAVFIFACVMGAVLGIYLLIVAGWEVKARADKLSPDPPVCVHDQTCQDRYGSLVQCTKKYYSDDAGHPINLPSAPVDDAGTKDNSK